MNKITIRTTRKELSQILYGDSDTLEGFSKKEVNQDIETKKELLQHIYDCIDEENYDEIHTCDLYALGDIINLLSALKIEIE